MYVPHGCQKKVSKYLGLELNTEPSFQPHFYKLWIELKIYSKNLCFTFSHVDTNMKTNNEKLLITVYPLCPGLQSLQLAIQHLFF